MLVFLDDEWYGFPSIPCRLCPFLTFSFIDWLLNFGISDTRCKVVYIISEEKFQFPCAVWQLHKINSIWLLSAQTDYVRRCLCVFLRMTESQRLNYSRRLKRFSCTFPKVNTIEANSPIDNDKCFKQLHAYDMNGVFVFNERLYCGECLRPCDCSPCTNFATHWPAR